MTPRVWKNSQLSRLLTTRQIRQLSLRGQLGFRRCLAVSSQLEEGCVSATATSCYAFCCIFWSHMCRADDIVQADDSSSPPPATFSAVVNCASVKAMMRSPEMRGCFPPPPAPPVVAVVAAVVLSGADLTAATTTVADALSAAATSEASVRAGAPLARAAPKAEIRSAVTFPVDIATISAGSSERTAFGVILASLSVAFSSVTFG